MATNTESKFTPFKLQLSNKATLTGISCIPSRNHCTPSAVPLLVGIHGGTCTAHNYDISPSCTASSFSIALGIPFVAIDRPGYGGTTSILPCDNFHEETGRWLHEYILPAVWKEFGEKNGCSGMVLNSHSMAVPQTTIMCDYREKEKKANGIEALKYPLTGVILSGFGVILNPANKDHFTVKSADEYPDMIKFPLQAKLMLMLSDPSLGLCEVDLYDKIEPQDVAFPKGELLGGLGWYIREEIRTKYCASVTVPVLLALGEYDHPWHGTWEHLQAWGEEFPNSPHLERTLVRSAPHAIEWSKAGKGWYAKIFGWAGEVTADYALRKARTKPVESL